MLQIDVGNNASQQHFYYQKSTLLVQDNETKI